MSAVAVGHEYREDDLPSIAAAPDGSIWAAWLSFAGNRDDVAIRHHEHNEWSNIQWVPGTSGDSWLPQVAVDGSNRVWAVWSQQVGGNWDIYARRFDPGRQQWGAMERLSNDPLPDINPRVWSDGKGKAVVVWQGFRGKNSNIFLRRLDENGWSPEVRVTNRAANDWDPAVAMDSAGTAWVAYDSYKNGNYDVFLSRVSGGRLDGPEMAVAATPRLEARASVAVDAADRVWVAWEAGEPNWGKDTGYIIRTAEPGAVLGGFREPRIRCYQKTQWREPETPVASAFPGGNTYQPHVFSDGRGGIWVAALVRKLGPKRPVFPPQPGYYEYYLTRLDGGKWTEAFPLPNSKGRLSTSIGAALATDQSLWLAWPTDNRGPKYYHRPVRQQVFAGQVPAAAPTSPLLRTPRDENVQAKPGHPDEAGDLKAIRAYSTRADNRAVHIVRGDFHRHTELSWDEGGARDGSLQDFYRYMIDAAALDFGASTDHQGGAWPYWWWYTQKMTDMYHVPDSYVSIFGYERSASFPFGHRNMFFARRSEARVTPFFLKDGVKIYKFPLSPEGDEPADETGQLAENDTRLLYEETRQGNGISIPHTSAMRNFGTDWKDNDLGVEPVVEIFQGCRASSEAVDAPYAYDAQKNFPAVFNPSGMVTNAWAKGYKLGIIASSDHHSTHFSYAMVYTDDFTRQGILNAIRKRHTYGATDNIVLEVRMGNHFMGDEFEISKAEPLQVRARGTATVAKLEVIRDGKVVYSVDPRLGSVDLAYLDKDVATGYHYYYVRLQQTDGMIAWSSPMFIHYRWP